MKGLCRDVGRLVGTIFRTTWHLWTVIVPKELGLMKIRTLRRFLREQGADGEVFISSDNRTGEHYVRDVGAMSRLAAEPPGGGKAKMIYRRLGSSGIKVSVASFGAGPARDSAGSRGGSARRGGAGTF